MDLGKWYITMWYRVTRYSWVFRRLTVGQRTPDFWGIIVGFVLRNLVTQSNFVEFQDNWNFHVFRDDGSYEPKNGIFEKNLEIGT